MTRLLAHRSGPADPTTGTPGNGTCLPDDATNSTRIDFQDLLLRKVLPMVKGGYIRIGGTYTDFVYNGFDINPWPTCLRRCRRRRRPNGGSV